MKGDLIVEKKFIRKKDYVDKKEYDYIYVAVRLGDLNKSDDVLVHDWIGLRFDEV